MADPDATESEGEYSGAAASASVSGAASGAAAAAANGKAGEGAPPQSIAAQLDALAVQEDMLLQQYQADMRRLDEVSEAFPRARRDGGSWRGFDDESK